MGSMTASSDLPVRAWSGGLTRTERGYDGSAEPSKGRACPRAGPLAWQYPAPMRALIFDLDGTLVDTVYGHVFAWQRALAEAGLPIDGWKVHRRIGMRGGVFTRAVAREVGRALSDAEAALIQKRHGELFRELLPERRPLPGAVELLRYLRDSGITHGIATSGRRPEI